MTEKYIANRVYRDTNIAGMYDKKRFTNYIGKLGDKAEKRAVINLLSQISQPIIFLDLPAGTGRFSELILSTNIGNKVVGADISREMLRIAKIKIGDNENLLGLVQCDAEHLPFKYDTFGGIVCVRLMGHLPPTVRKNVETEMARVAKKWIITTYADTLRPLAIYRKLKSIIKGYPWNQISKKSLKNEVNKFGLSISMSEQISLMAETYAVLLEK